MTTPVPDTPDCCAACGADTVSFIREVWAWRTKRYLKLSFCETCESFMMPANFSPSDKALEKSVDFHKRVLERNQGWSVTMWDHLLATYDIRYGVAEIGSGNGAALAEAGKRGLTAVGFELNRHVAAYARETFGLDVRETHWSADTEMPRVDVITCLSVLEHLEDPLALASEFARYLKANSGICVINVPIVREEHWKFVVQPSRDGSPFVASDEHVVYFSPKGMEQLLDRAGFTAFDRKSTGGWNLYIAKVD